MGFAKNIAEGFILAKATLLVVVLLLPSQASACSCLASTLCEYFETANFVLRAEVIERTEAPTVSGDDTVYTVEIIDVFKDDYDAVAKASEYAVGETFDFATASSSAACGVYLEIGEEYLLGLSRGGDGNDELRASLCGMTTAWSTVSEDNEKLLESSCGGGDDDGTDDDIDDDDDDDDDDVGDGVHECLEDSDCGESAECLLYSVESFDIDQYYCSPTCDPNPCEEDEACSLRFVVCTQSLTPCRPQRICTSDPCGGDCDEFQDCLPFTTYSFLAGSGAEEYRCADSCDPDPCDEDEKCTLQPTYCTAGSICPDVRVCLPKGSSG